MKETHTNHSEQIGYLFALQDRSNTCNSISQLDMLYTSIWHMLRSMLHNILYNTFLPGSQNIIYAGYSAK